MSPNDNPNLAIPANQKLKTPLKASVVILTSFILAACGTSGKSQSYNLSDITPIVGDGISKDKYEEEKKKAEDAKKEAEEALKAKEEAEKAKEEALKAKEEAEKAKEEAEKALEDALAGGGNKAELEKIAEEKAKEAETAQNVAEEKAKQAQEALQAAEIKNAPESTKTGVQHINIDASGLGQGELTTTTRDFKVTDKTQVDARADIASGGLVSDPVALKVSGDSDAGVDGSNGFKSFSNTTKVVTSSLGEQDLIYTSTYKDYGDDLRVAHIDGKAAGLLPVNGVAAVGNATKADNVPTEGKVGYTGDATYRKAGDNLIEYGKSVFNVDFVAKNLTGDLTFSDKKIGLQAAIDGNKFSGSKDGYNADGGFYGGDAQYLGGVYEGNGAQGTYGAKSDKQAAADKVAADAKAAADDAKAAAEKAKQEAERAKKRAENAGSGDGEALAEAEARADAAEEAAKAAEEAKLAAEKALKAAEEAEAQAIAEKEAAEKEAAEKIAAVESAAEEDIADAKKIADEAQAKAKTAQEKAAQAEADRLVAEDAAKKAEEAKAEAEAAKKAADERIKELEAELDALKNQDAYTSEAEADKSGVQHLSVDASGLELGVKTTTSREFSIRSTSDVDARADLALTGLIQAPIAIQVSGDNDAETSNGFKAYEGTGTVLSEGDLAYTSIYKDFGDNGELRIAHIDGAAVGGAVPVNGVVALGNKTVTLPTEGEAKYAGDATHRKVGVEGQVEYGSSEFTADFVNKSLDGTLKFKQAGDIALKAGIDGNEFSGSAADNNGYNTEGAFYGKDAKYIGGIYEGNGSQGTYGATKDGTPADLVEPEPELPEPPVNEKYEPETDLTGFQSNTLSSKKFLSITDDAIGYAAIRDDKSDFDIDNPEDTIKVDGDTVAVDNRKGDNFTSYDKFVARADMTKPDSVKQQVEVNISGESDKDYGNGFMSHTESTKVQGPVALDLDYTSVYRNFGSQMQIGHIYGDPKLGTTDLARVSNVFVQGNGTSLDDMKYMKELAQYNFDNGISDGMVNYTGVATYMENLHLKNGARSGPVVDGTSSFNVDFINNSVKGELAFGAGDYNYMPEGNKIGIEATIDGNTFKGNANNIDTAGGFYGEDAKFLGGIYQQALEVGGKGGQPGEGTTFQGTFGAEKK